MKKASFFLEGRADVDASFGFVTQFFPSSRKGIRDNNTSKVEWPTPKLAFDQNTKNRMHGGCVTYAENQIYFILNLVPRVYLTREAKRGAWERGCEILPHWSVSFFYYYFFYPVRQLHREFLRAGADVMQTFTFYASDDKLKNRGNTASEKIGVRTSQIAPRRKNYVTTCDWKRLQSPLYFRVNYLVGLSSFTIFRWPAMRTTLLLPVTKSLLAWQVKQGYAVSSLCRKRQATRQRALLLLSIPFSVMSFFGLSTGLEILF